MFRLIDTKDSRAVEREVARIYQGLFNDCDREFVSRVFGWALAAFRGEYKDYLPIDARYHDLEHTMQGTLCLARLLEGYAHGQATPRLTREAFELTLIAILMHDTGYLKERWDASGTGAKYTLIHVQRSAEFAARLLLENGWREEQARAVQHMIRCTGVNVDLSKIPFQNELEMRLGFALGSSDLLGQMAAPDYVEKLPILFTEFVESARYSSGKQTATGLFSSAEDLIAKTPGFWEFYVLPKLRKDFQNVCDYLERPLGSGVNEYVKRIEANLARLPIAGR